MDFFLLFPFLFPSLLDLIPLPSDREGEYFEARDLSTSAGGSIFGTTPGGSRIVYDRETLLSLRNSPMAQTPPKGMQRIPGVTTIDRIDADILDEADDAKAEHEDEPEDEPVHAATTFAMDD